MVKKEKKETDLKEELRKEEVKERFTNLAFDLFSKGADDEAVKREISVFIPNVDVDLVQRLRSQWQSKQSVDKEIEAIDRGEGPLQKPKPTEVEPSVKPSVELPPAEEKPVEPAIGDEEIEKKALLKAAGEQPPAEEKTKPSEVEPTPTPEGKPIEKPPAPSLRDEVEAERSRAEIVRATEELRRAITSEIRAQESYERARLELDNAKRELNVVRAELDEFKSDIDLLKLKERVVEREPLKQPRLASETEEGKRLEKEISMKPFNRAVEEIVEKKIKERELKEAVPMPPVEKKVVEKTTGEKNQDEIDKVEKKQQELDAETTEQTVAAKVFYDRLLKHLHRHKYLVVRMGDEEPEVFKQNLTLRGAVIGVAVGIPAGCLVLYLVLLLTGML